MTDSQPADPPGRREERLEQTVAQQTDALEAQLQRIALALERIAGVLEHAQKSESLRRRQGPPRNG
jgi:hypothetical protein